MCVCVCVCVCTTIPKENLGTSRYHVAFVCLSDLRKRGIDDVRLEVTNTIDSITYWVPLDTQICSIAGDIRMDLSQYTH